MVSRLRNSASTTASPTATSPAATAMVKTLNTWPVRLFSCRLKVMKLMFAAFIISSIDIRMMIALRRVSTPSMPMEKSSRLKTRRCVAGTGIASFPSALLARQDDRADHRNQQQDRGHLERQQVVPVETDADGLEIPSLSQRRSGGDRHELAAAVQVEDQPHHRQPDDAGDGGMQPDPISEAVLKIHEHDDEQEEDHDAAGIDQHLDGGDELRLEQHVDAGHRQEGEHQIDRRMDGAPAADHHEPRQDRDRGQDVKDRRGGGHTGYS